MTVNIVIYFSFIIICSNLLKYMAVTAKLLQILKSSVHSNLILETVKLFLSPKVHVVSLLIPIATIMSTNAVNKKILQITSYLYNYLSDYHVFITDEFIFVLK